MQDIPMHFTRIFEKPNCNTVNRCITPSLVKEPSSPVQVVEVVLVDFASPEFHICNLKIAPEMACRVSIGLSIVFWSSRTIFYPVHSIVGVDVLWMFGQKLDRLRPQSRNALWCIVQIYRKAVCLVVVLHVSEDVIVDIAEKMYFWLDSPVETSVC